MSALIERLRKALGGDYDVLDELASGGMGVVFRARDRALDRLVAVKVIHPQLATAVAIERFLREARLLASFRHPNIVPVHHAGEGEGLTFYIMDLLEGETLAARLRRGPLPPAEGLAVADDLLAALEAVHARGIVHRDLKPANIFLANGRAVLGDFGISKAAASGDPTLTAPGHAPLTPAYSPPEQLAGGEATARTDLCAAAMVIYEALTARAWSFDSHADAADWSGVPPGCVAALRRALAWAPRERWADARSFRRALAARRSRPPGARVAIVAAVMIALAWASLRVFLARSAGAGALLTVAVHPFTTSPGAGPAAGDSISVRLVRALRGAADIDFVLARAARGTRAFDVEGSVARAGDALSVSLHASSTARGGPSFDLSARGSDADLVDSLARELLLNVWKAYDRVPTDLPGGALPQRPAGLVAWARAEALYARAEWSAAARAYAAAASADSTCVLCDLRLMTIDRWLRLEPDPARTQRVLAAIDRFPAHYKRLIRAGIDTVDRWAALDSMVSGASRFDLALFIYGDELFHRGALAGRRRGDAMRWFRTVTQMRPTFAPAWEHLAWVAIAEGNAAMADSALRTYLSLTARTDTNAAVVQAVLQVGNFWRFHAPDSAAAFTAGVLRTPEISGLQNLPWGGHYLLVFDAPESLVWLGNYYTRWQVHPELETPGLVAQVVGLLALGRVDSARAVERRLAGASPDAEYALSAAEFDAAQVLFDSSQDARAAWPALSARLQTLTMQGASRIQQRRAAWMLTLLSRRAAERAPGRWRTLVNGETGRHAFTTLLDADSVGRASPALALSMSRRLLALDSAGQAGDPFFRTALHMLRAQWYARDANLPAARKELLWHENDDLVGRPGAIVWAADVDAAFGTLARWDRARLFAQDEGGDEACRAWAGVARLWVHADARYAARADTAVRRRAALHCPAAS